MTPDVSIIICTRDRVRCLAETLAAVASAVEVSNRNCEVLVMDNGTVDHDGLNAASLIDGLSSRYPCALACAHVNEAGKARSCNAALGFARGGILLWTDDDVRPPLSWISEMVDRIGSGLADAQPGHVNLVDDFVRPWMRRAHFDRLSDTRFLPETFDLLIGANMAFSREVLRKVPRFDPSLGPGALGFMEDTLFAMQLKEAGLIVAPILGSPVIHTPLVDRRKRRSWLHNGVCMGRSMAYVDHHWNHLETRFVRARARLWSSAYRLFLRCSRPGPLDGEGCDRKEIRLKQIQTYWSTLSELGLNPRKYVVHGLVERSV